MTQRFSINIEGREIVIETGKMAKQADGAVTVQSGGTVVLVSAVYAKEPKESIMDMVPLTVEYQEKTYAAGKIPGGFFKREGRPSEKEILTARLIDRPIRPLFPKGYLNETQVMSIVLSADGENDPDILALIGASAALTISEIPFKGPIGALRVGRVDDRFILNPTFAELKQSSLDLVVVGNKKGVGMLECGASEVSEDLVLEAINFGYKNLLKLIELQEEMAKACGKKKAEPKLRSLDPVLAKRIKEEAGSKIGDIYKIAQKEQRMEALALLSKEIMEKFAGGDDPDFAETDVKAALIDLEKEVVRRIILDGKKRVDGRGFGEIRPITCEIGLLPRTHGSGLFTRGQTQSLSVTTLGTSADEQTIDALEGEESKSFMLHYNFPPFSVGEVKPVRGPGRREIGHGALAERALKPVMPSKEEFPYTVRVVSDILESNGSSSMATVCAATLSLMDAGVPIKAPVSGVAIGLVKEADKHVLLMDIGGIEDHFGDMDFKVAGTKKGVTAIQLDLKTDSIGMDIVKEVLKDAHGARLTVLDKMLT
ncbi:MAG: polyribonucleotide nucleotidyltransferase, partial [Candidatus Omnitrophica bacterium]|nr:polyribonucleotide nucleotidyltransferase [Candidatus Omnitrophota bacterium]